MHTEVTDQTRSREVYKAWWPKSELPLGKPPALWSHDRNRHLGVAFLAGLFGIPLDEALYFDGVFFFADSFHDLIPYSLPLFLVAPICMLGGLWLQHGMWQRVRVTELPSLGIRFFYYLICCIPMIGLIFAAIVSHQSRKGLPNKPIPKGLILNSISVWSRQASALVQRLASDSIAVAAVYAMLTIHHFGLWFYGALHWTHPRSIAPLTWLLVYSLITHGIVAFSLWELISKNSLKPIRRFDRALVILVMTPIPYLAFMIWFFVFMRVNQQSRDLLVTRVFGEPVSRPHLFLQERARLDRGYSTGRTVMHPRSPDEQQITQTREDKMIGALFRLLLLQVVLQTPGLLLIMLQFTRISLAWIGGLVFLSLLYSIFGILIMIYYSWRSWKRTMRANGALSGFNGGASAMFGGFLLACGSLFAGELHGGQVEHAGMMVMTGAFLMVPGILFVLFIRQTAIARIQIPDILMLAGYGSLCLCFVAFGALLAGERESPRILIPLMTGLGLGAPLVNAIMLHEPLRWLERNLVRTGNSQCLGLFGFLVVMPPAALLVPLLFHCINNFRPSRRSNE